MVNFKKTETVKQLVKNKLSKMQISINHIFLLQAEIRATETSLYDLRK